MRWIAVVVIAGCWTHEVIEPARTQAIAPRTTHVPVPQVRAAGDAPSIALGDALDAARSYALDRGVKFDRQYLQGAVFDAVARQWVFDWQMPNVKGGLTIVTVHESGAITINYGD